MNTVSEAANQFDLGTSPQRTNKVFVNTRVPPLSADRIEALLKSARTKASAFSRVNLIYPESIRPIAERLAADGRLPRDATERDVASVVGRFVDNHPAHVRSTGAQATLLRRKGLSKAPEFPELSHEALKHLTAEQLLEFANTGKLPPGFLQSSSKKERPEHD